MSDGLVYTIRHLQDFGLFDAQRSWLEGCDDPRIKILRYEDLAEDEASFLVALFSHCDIDVSRSEVDELVKRNGFKAMTHREQGQEDQHEHLRKGISGDWQNYFDDQIKAKFDDVTIDLLDSLGYDRM
jgi:hypothetical protein